MKVLILGCGPAGLIAAHAAAMAGADVLIYSKPRMSYLFGCQYLHEPIVGVTPPDPVRVSYSLVGTPEEYRRKVYGTAWRGDVSPSTLDREHLAWDLRETYEELWFMYGSFVQEALFTEGDGADAIEQLIDYARPDLTISTIPAPLLCRDRAHAFHSEDVYALGDAPERGQVLDYGLADDSIVCNATSDVAWYRASRVFGYTTVEWPNSKKPPIPGVALVRKPLGTTCDCLPQVHRMGRYGKWTKGVLSHEAYRETNALMEQLRTVGVQGVLL